MVLFSPLPIINLSVILPALYNRICHAIRIKFASERIPRFSISRPDESLPCSKSLNSSGIQGIKTRYNHIDSIVKGVNICYSSLHRSNKSPPFIILNQRIEGFLHSLILQVIQMQTRIRKLLINLLHCYAQIQWVPLPPPILYIQNSRLSTKLLR